MDPRLLPAGMTENWVMPDRFNGESPSPHRHARQLLSGSHLEVLPDGSPLTTGGDDRKLGHARH